MNLFCDTMIYHTSCPKTYSIYNINFYSFYLILFTCYYCFSMKKTHKTKHTKFCTALTLLKFCDIGSKHILFAHILWAAKQKSQPYSLFPCRCTDRIHLHPYILTEATWPRSKHQSLGQPEKISTHLHMVMAAHGCAMKGPGSPGQPQAAGASTPTVQVCCSQTSEARCCSAIGQLTLTRHWKQRTTRQLSLLAISSVLRAIFRHPKASRVTYMELKI